MAQLSHRVFALTLAVVFFITAFGFSFIVIWQSIDSHNSNNSSSNTNPSTSSSKTLVGTKMTDFTPVSSVPSLKITDQKVGSGTLAQAGDTVTVLYTGALASNGIIFQTTSDSGQPAKLSLDGVIQGWQKGIPGMRVGGTRQLLIPAAEAYGANPPTDTGGSVQIPPNADLVFDITLLQVSS